MLCACDCVCEHVLACKTLAKQNHKMAVDMPQKLNTQLDLLWEQSQDAKVYAYFSLSLNLLHMFFRLDYLSCLSVRACMHTFVS